MEYNLVSVRNVKAIKDILLSNNISRPIDLRYDHLKLYFHSDRLSIPQKSSNFGDKMDEVFFLNSDTSKVLTVNHRKYEVFINIGEWGYDTRIPSSHLCLGTRPVKYGSKYFSQLELSQALEDETYIYIVKNISKLSGEGSISRLNHGLYSDKQLKYKRRDKLVNLLNGQVISFDNQEWLNICKILKSDLKKKKKYDKILCDILSSFIYYAFSVEYIINSITPDRNDDLVNEVSEISLERTMCFGTCPVYKVTLRKDGSATYNGEWFVDKIGLYAGIISEHSFHRISELVDLINFSNLKDGYYYVEVSDDTCLADGDYIQVTDAPSTITNVVYSKGEKRIDNYGNNGPYELQLLEEAIDYEVSLIEWLKVEQ